MLVGILALYLFLIASQSTYDVVRVSSVVALFVVALVCEAGMITLRSARARGIVGACASGLLLSMAVLALFSIGLLLLVAGVLVTAWVIRTRSERRGLSGLPMITAFVVGALLPWSLLLLG